MFNCTQWFLDNNRYPQMNSHMWRALTSIVLFIAVWHGTVWAETCPSYSRGRVIEKIEQPPRLSLRLYASTDACTAPVELSVAKKATWQEVSRNSEVEAHVNEKGVIDALQIREFSPAPRQPTQIQVR